MDEELLQKAQEAFPDESPEIIQQGIAKVQSLNPDASPDQIIQLAQKAKENMSGGMPAPVIKPPVTDGSTVPESPIQNTAVKRYITNLYGDRFSDQAREKIVNQNREEAGGVHWGAGLQSLGAGLSGGDAQAAGQRALASEKASRDERLNEFDKGKAQVAADYQAGRQVKSDVEGEERLKRERSPDSPESKLAQQAALEMGVKPEYVNGLTAEQFKSQGPIYEKIYNAKQKKLDRENDRKTKQDDRREREQAQTLTSTKTILESARGNPAAAQAEKDLYAAKKANSLADLYGDPNKLSNEQVKLLASEVGKIASGGVPSMHELEGITPNTLTGKLSGIVTKFTNSPTKANAGEFVKQYKDYTRQLSADAKKVIQDKYGRVIESSKNRLSQTDYDALQQQYIKRFDDEVVDDKAYDPDVTAYAKEHGITPDQAMAIKQQRMSK